MNFFELQAEARRRSRVFVVLFALAILSILLVLNLVTGCLLVLFRDLYRPFPDVSFFAWIGENVEIFAWVTITQLGFFVFGSAHMSLQLRSGGSAVAQSIRAKWILPSTTDLAQRQVLNIVEELAIAASLPVPQVYLLERETGINTFSAGHNPANAAIIVTQGALERLNRAELQGVIAHEFSHILNGDMALNIRLMAPLHGLMFVPTTLRALFTFNWQSPVSLGVVVGGLVLIPLLFLRFVVGIRTPMDALIYTAVMTFIIGALGSFFASTLQAAVARRREMLADALAVQLTRDTSGLKGALVKISAMAFGSYLQHTNAEGIAHMLFAQGTIRSFETHPSLTKRLKALDAGFSEREIDELRARRRSLIPEAEINQRFALRRKSKAAALSSTEIRDLVGNPGFDQLSFAQFVLGTAPLAVVSATQEPASARALLLALALDFGTDPSSHERQNRQLRFIAQQLDADTATAVTALCPDVSNLEHAQRIPVLLRLFPALRQLASSERRQLLDCLTMLLQREGHSPYSYALRKLAQVHLSDELGRRDYPHNLPLRVVRAELQIVFSVLAHQGSTDLRTSISAYDSGMQHLLANGSPSYAVPSSWPASLDTALNRLDRLSPLAKARLVEALVLTISYDRQLVLAEAELLRAICGSLHCPLPPLFGAEA